ncbi:hypothetical protein [Streptomyces sp. NPDC093089]|uniref:hypothetical protein n=1 Tax=Streptomyces sp. NPDC093089 TaxID=3366024 RepID=UPI003806ED6A
MTDGQNEQLQLDLLGSPSAHCGGQPLDLEPLRRQAVLAGLVLRAGSRVSREKPLADVWGDNPPMTDVRVLPSHICSRARPWTRRGGIRVLHPQR